MISNLNLDGSVLLIPNNPTDSNLLNILYHLLREGCTLEYEVTERASGDNSLLFTTCGIPPASRVYEWINGVRCET